MGVDAILWVLVILVAGTLSLAERIISVGSGQFQVESVDGVGFYG